MVAFAVVAAVCAFWLAPYAVSHARAAAVLLRAAGRTGGLAAWFDGPVRVERVTLPGAGVGPAALEGRVYRPAEGGRGRAFVLVHGAQREGSDARAVVSLATSLAAAGVVVVTPELRWLRDGGGLRGGAGELAAWVRFAASRPYARAGGACVVGASMAGGLALLAAGRDDARPWTACVVAVGAHNDLERVLRFGLAGGAGARDFPRRDPYALWLFANTHPAAVVDARDAEQFGAAAGALSRWDAAGARAHAAALDPAAQALFDALSRGDGRALGPRFSSALVASRGELRALSPAGRMGGLRGLRVYLLHGAFDDLIPPGEAYANADELRGVARVRLVITPALRHVAFEPSASWWQRWRVVDLLARVLDGR